MESEAIARRYYSRQFGAKPTLLTADEVHSGTSAAAVWRSTSTMVGQVGQSFIYGCSM
jgi:hypothetical protein